ncbi:uncharacterized protein FIBRA_00384 [Fibroporia radiculosa]|uniref:Uncharacterized protein n=1 Tax=Fibroporia radiculosa TaxID=599839 RepID=J4GZW8_9APHY|nr:uncharacterized protein FIBRA_00384 [Fibroporia radiculosa]CCL98389.1 predicted protein [Fibroporia radiculosa]
MARIQINTFMSKLQGDEKRLADLEFNLCIRGTGSKASTSQLRSKIGKDKELLASLKEQLQSCTEYFANLDRPFPPPRTGPPKPTYVSPNSTLPNGPRSHSPFRGQVPNVLRPQAPLTGSTQSMPRHPPSPTGFFGAPRATSSPVSQPPLNSSHARPDNHQAPKGAPDMSTHAEVDILTAQVQQLKDQLSQVSSRLERLTERLKETGAADCEGPKHKPQSAKDASPPPGAPTVKDVRRAVQDIQRMKEEFRMRISRMPHVFIPQIQWDPFAKLYTEASAEAALIEPELPVYVCTFDRHTIRRLIATLMVIEYLKHGREQKKIHNMIDLESLSLTVRFMKDIKKALSSGKNHVYSKDSESSSCFASLVEIEEEPNLPVTVTRPASTEYVPTTGLKRARETSPDEEDDDDHDSRPKKARLEHGAEQGSEPHGL